MEMIIQQISAFLILGFILGYAIRDIMQSVREGKATAHKKT